MDNAANLSEAARTLVEAFDLRSLPPAFYADPFPWYHALRALDPVRQMPDGSYFLTRYADVIAVYKDQLTFSSDKKAEFAPKYGDSLLYQHHTTSLVFNDPPLHTRVRRLILGALTPRAIEAMEPGLITLVDGLLDRMAASGAVDLVEDYACAIPVEIIGNLLGVPHAERGPLREWSLAILGALEPVVTPEAFERGNRALAQFLPYLETLVARRRADPGDPEHDVLTRLIQGEADGERLTHAELLHNCVFLLNAGHETTTNLIGNALHSLTQWPQEKARLIDATRADQDRGRGVPALRELEPARQPHHHPCDRARRAWRCPPAPGSRSASAPPTATRRSSRTRTGSTSRATPTVTSRSAPARISAPACTSPGSKAASPSAASSRASPTTHSLASRCVAGALASAAFSAFRVPCTGRLRVRANGREAPDQQH